METPRKKPFGRKLQEFFARINNPISPTRYDSRKLRKSLDPSKSENQTFLPFIKERDGMNRIRDQPHVYPRKNEIYETLDEAKRGVCRYLLRRSKPKIELSPKDTILSKFRYPESTPRKKHTSFKRPRIQKSLSVKKHSTKSPPGVGEYEVKYPEKHHNAFVPKTGRDTLWITSGEENASDGELNSNAAKIYIDIHKSSMPSPRFKSQTGRGILLQVESKAPEEAEGEYIENVAKKMEAEENYMEWLKETRRKLMYKKMLELEVEVKDRMKKIESLVPKKKK